MPRRWRLRHLLTWLFAGLIALTAKAAVDDSLSVIRQVGVEGAGNAAASRAWPEITQAGPSALAQILKAMDGASDLSVNWLRAAAETVADRAVQSNTPLPSVELGAFLLDTRHHPKARRLAFELLSRSDPSVGDLLWPGFLDDPSQELRREAIDRLLQLTAKTQQAGRRDLAVLGYRQALGFAREADQIEAIVKPLRELGESVNLPLLLGFVTNWLVVGPFDNTKGAGFETAFPPEQALSLQAVFDGKGGKVRWQPQSTTNEYGILDLNQACGTLKEVTGYAVAEFVSESARPAELRLGCKNAWKVWFNGRYLFGRDEYHRGMEIDQYRLPVELKAGANVILLKVCQNEQKEDWTKEWEFQLRVCDPGGRAVHSTSPPGVFPSLSQPTP